MPAPSCAIAARRLTVAVAALLAAPMSLRGQEDQPPARPAAAKRTVQVYDFEEHRPDSRGEVNPERIPRYWDPVQYRPGAVHSTPGFPDWNEIAFDRTVAHEGEASVRLPTRGGSARLRLQPGALPVFPRGDYLVTAYIRTERLKHARASVAARFLDGSRRPIAQSEARSALVESQGRWTPVTIQLHGSFEAAAFLQIDLDLLQDEQARLLPGAERRGTTHVSFEDVNGAAWFDDVSVYLIPRTELATSSPGNVFVQPQSPTLRFFVRDMVGDELSARLTVRDLDQRPVAAHDVPVDPGGRTTEWSPSIERCGWYTAELDIVHGDLAVAHADVQFVVLPPIPAASAPRREDQRRLGLLVDQPTDPADPWPSWLPRVLPRLGTGFVVLPAADASARLNDGSAKAATRGSVLEALLQERQDVTLAYAGPIDAATGRVADPAGLVSIMSRDESAWLPAMTPLIDAYGQRIRRWQLGLSEDPFLCWDRDLSAATVRFHDGIGRYVPGPVLSVPWRADESGATLPAAAGAVTLTIPWGFPAGAVPAALKSWRSAADQKPGGAPEVTVSFELPPAETYGRRAAAAELLKRAAELWTTFPATASDSEAVLLRLALASPWSASTDLRPDALPGPHLAVFRTIADCLAGRRFVTSLPVAPGVRCIVLADLPSDGGPIERSRETVRGTIVAWNESAPAAEAVLHAYLGDNPVTQVDLFGNRTALAPDADASRGYTVPIPETPIILEGIDPQVAKLVASFRVEPAFVRAVATEHEAALVLENPWPVRVTGRLQIVEPADGKAGWTVSPATIIPLSIAPRSIERVPFTFSFSPGEEAGSKSVLVRVQLTADHTLPPLELRAPLEIGLPDLEFSPEVLVTPARELKGGSGAGGGGDVIVTLGVTNRSAHARTLRLDTIAPGFPSQQQTVSNLGPGESVRKRFIYKNAHAALSGRRILTAVGDIDAPERLNRSVRVP